MFFPVPDEVYSSPKYLELSDSAMALYTRAGSWSAHHLEDGYVPSTVLALFQASEQTAEELVAQRVWRRSRGGFQYVDWPRQATKSYVEAERERNREKQKRHRQRHNGGSHRLVTGDSPVSDRGSNRVTNRPQPTNQTHHHPSGGGGGFGSGNAELSTGELSTSDGRAAFKKALDREVAADSAHLRCQHGTPAGKILRPGTNVSATCARCRKEQPQEQP